MQISLNHMKIQIQLHCIGLSNNQWGYLQLNKYIYLNESLFSELISLITILHIILYTISLNYMKVSLRKLQISSTTFKTSSISLIFLNFEVFKLLEDIVKIYFQIASNNLKIIMTYNHLITHPQHRHHAPVCQHCSPK